MVELHSLFNVSGQFSVGFIVSDDCEAEHEVGDYGRVYYLAPAKIVSQSSSNSRSFKARFKLTEKDRLISLGVHELVHGMACRGTMSAMRIG
jgi:hypothetical protein